MKTITFNISEKLSMRLQRLADDAYFMNGSKTEVLRKSIAIYEALVKEVAKGNAVMVINNADDKPIKIKQIVFTEVE